MNAKLLSRNIRQKIAGRLEATAAMDASHGGASSYGSNFWSRMTWTWEAARLGYTFAGDCAVIVHGE